jgi:hypothetical protein
MMRRLLLTHYERVQRTVAALSPASAFAFGAGCAEWTFVRAAGVSSTIDPNVYASSELFSYYAGTRIRHDRWRAGGVSPLMGRCIRGLTPPARR